MGPGTEIGVFLLASGLLLVPLARRLALRVLVRRASAYRVAVRTGGFTLSESALVLGASLLALFASSYFPGAGVLSNLARGALVLSFVSVLVLSIAWNHSERFAALGIARGSTLRSAVAGLVAYPLVLPVLHGALQLWPVLCEWMGFPQQQQEVLRQLVELSGPAELVPAFFLAAVLVPILEETLFRGFLQSSLIKAMGALPGVLLTSLLFALLHGPSVLLPIFLLSLFLGWLQLTSGRLAAACCVHGLHNALHLALALMVDRARAGS